MANSVGIINMACLRYNIIQEDLEKIRRVQCFNSASTGETLNDIYNDFKISNC
jgi:hypothetical protein